MADDVPESAGQPAQKKSRWVFVVFVIVVLWLAFSAVRKAMDAAAQ
jgi:hypothetical protein